MAEIKKPFNREDNLIPFNKRSKEEVRMLNSKGGSVRSEAKTLANKLNAMKRSKKISDEKYLSNMEFFENSDLAAFQIKEKLDQIDRLCKEKANTYSRIQLMEKYLQLHKSVHGEKHHIKQETQNVNLNVNLDIVKFQELMKKYDNDKISPSGQ